MHTTPALAIIYLDYHPPVFIHLAQNVKGFRLFRRFENFAEVSQRRRKI